MILDAFDLFNELPPHRAVAAFNVISVEHADAIAAAAEQVDTPVIMQLSENAIRFHRRPDAIAAAMVAVARVSSAPVVLHLDHITDMELARSTARLGFSSVMYDGAAFEYAENVAKTHAIVDWSENAGVWVEAELGKIGGKDGAHAPGVRTDPDEARQFAEQTGVDSLAVAVGSSHAMVEKSAALDLNLIERMAATVDVPLVLHGSSGVPDDLLRRAAEAGMRKINIGTALNIAFTGAVRSGLDGYGGVDPRKYIGPARDAVTETCAHYLRVVAASGA